MSPVSEDRVERGERRWPLEGNPAIIAPEPPPAARDYRELLAQAQQMLATRRERFPAMIERGRIDPDEAARELRAFEDLVTDWRFICTGEGEPADPGSEQARRDALDEAIVRIAGFAAERDGLVGPILEQAHRVIALRWHLDPGRQTLAMARLTHEIRASVRSQAGEPDHG